MMQRAQPAPVDGAEGAAASPGGEPPPPDAVAGEGHAAQGSRGRQKSLRQSFWSWGRAAFALATIFLAWQLLLIARGVVSALLGIVLLTIFAGVVALVCAPVANGLERYLRFPRTVAVLVALLGLVFAAAGLVLLVANPLVVESRILIADLPKLDHQLSGLQSWLSQRGINIGSLSLGSVAGRLFNASSIGTGGFVFSALTGTFSFLVDLVVVLVSAFWFLRDDQRLRHLIVDNLPSGWRAQVDFGFSAFTVVIGGYVRGQLVMALIVGTLAGVGSAVIGVPLPLVVAVAAGFFELIPMVGPFVGAAVAAVLALTVSPFLVIEVLIVFLVIHGIEGYLVAPRLQAKFVRLHPVVSFLALFTGIEVGGFLGAVVAVPLASFAAVMLSSVIGDVRAQHPELFEGHLPPASVAAERRRRSLLREYRIFQTNPFRHLGRWLRGER